VNGLATEYAGGCDKRIGCARTGRPRKSHARPSSGQRCRRARQDLAIVTWSIDRAAHPHRVIRSRYARQAAAPSPRAPLMTTTFFFAAHAIVTLILPDIHTVRLHSSSLDARTSGLGAGLILSPPGEARDTERSDDFVSGLICDPAGGAVHVGPRRECCTVRLLAMRICERARSVEPKDRPERNDCVCLRKAWWW